MSFRPEFPHYATIDEPKLRHLSRWWLTAAILFVVISLIAGSASVIVLFRAFEADAATYIDDPAILSVVEHECDRMTKTVDSLIITGSPRHQAEIIIKQNKAVQRMIDAVLALDPDLLAADKPTLDWVADWQQLVNLRDTLANQLKHGHLADLAEPKDANGHSVLDRMDWASEPECVIPETLLNPYPEYVEDV